MASVNVKVDNLFPNLIATKNIDISKLNVTGDNFKKTFGSDIKTTLNGNTLFDKNSINYLNIELRSILGYLLKPYCKNFVFNVCDASCHYKCRRQSIGSLSQTWTFFETNRDLSQVGRRLKTACVSF